MRDINTPIAPGEWRDVHVPGSEQTHRIQQMRNLGDNGIVFVANPPNSGTRFGSDNDTALITGMRLAQACLGEAEEWADLTVAMRAVETLLKVTGTAGVLARTAFRARLAWENHGWKSDLSDHPGNTWATRPSMYVRRYNGEDWVFQTKTTRDQLTGILFGLTHASFRPEVRAACAIQVDNLYHRMMETNWSLEDHEGRSGTSAGIVDRPQRLILRALQAKLNGGKKPKELWFRFVCLMTAHYNRQVQATYSYNLNMMDALSLCMLKDWHHEESGVRQWHKRLYSKVRDDHNPWFDAMNYAVTGNQIHDESWINFLRGTQADFRNTFRWSKSPEDWELGKSGGYGPLVDTLLPGLLASIPPINWR